MSDPIWAGVLFDVHEVCSQQALIVSPKRKKKAASSQDPELLQYPDNWLTGRVNKTGIITASTCMQIRPPVLSRLSNGLSSWLCLSLIIKPKQSLPLVYFTSISNYQSNYPTSKGICFGYLFYFRRYLLCPKSEAAWRKPCLKHPASVLSSETHRIVLISRGWKKTLWRRKRSAEVTMEFIGGRVGVTNYPWRNARLLNYAKWHKGVALLLHSLTSVSSDSINKWFIRWNYARTSFDTQLAFNFWCIVFFCAAARTQKTLQVTGLLLFRIPISYWVYQ